MPGVIIPRSRQGDAVAPVVGLPQLQPEAPGLEPAVRGLAQGTAAVTDIGAKIRLQEDEARVTDALTLAERRWQNALYSAKDGLLQRRGVNALEGDGRRSVIDDGLEMRQSILDEAMATLGTPRQQTALKSAWAARDRFAIDSLQRHMDREREVYRDSADEGYIAIQQEGLILAEDDIARSVFLAQIAGKAQEIADRKGLAPEAADVMIRELTSPALESAIGNMARTDPEGARKLFEDRREFIKADRFEAIGAKIERESVTLRSQEIVEQAWNTVGGGSLVAIERYIRANTSGDTEDDALSRARSRFSVEEHERRTARENVSNGLDAGIWRFVSQPHTAQETAAYRDELVRSIQDRGLDVSDGASLLSNFDKLTAGKPPETDPTAWGQLWNIRVKDHATFRDMDLAGWRAHFTREDFNELQSEQKDLRAGGAGLKSSPSGLGALEVAKKVAIDAGIEGKEWENQFELRAHRAIAAAQDAQPDKLLTAKEKEEIAVSVLDEVPVTGFFFDGKIPIGKMTAKQRKKTEADPPDELIEMARGDLSAVGLSNPTDQQIEEWIADYFDASGVPRE